MSHFSILLGPGAEFSLICGATPLAIHIDKGLQCTPYRDNHAVSYQSPYPVTVWAQLRLVSEAIRSGIRMSLFQPSQHASMIAS